MFVFWVLRYASLCEINPPVILAHFFRNPPPPTSPCVRRTWMTPIQKISCTSITHRKSIHCLHFEGALYSLI